MAKVTYEGLYTQLGPAGVPIWGPEGTRAAYPERCSGSPSWALEFNGIDQYIWVDWSAAGTISEFTWEAWVWIDPDISVKGYFFSCGNSFSSNVDFWVSPTGWGAYLHSAGSPGNTRSRTGSALPTGEWTHLAVTWTMNAYPNLWVNGVSDNVSSSSNFTLNAVLITKGNIGKHSYSLTDPTNPDDGYFLGKIDCMALSNYAKYTDTFTPPSSQFYFSTGLSGVLAMHRMDEGTGNVTSEIVGDVDDAITGFDESMWVLGATTTGAPAADPTTVTPLSLPSVLPNFLAHDWSKSCQLTTTYRVDVSRSFTLAEERRLLADRPNRSVTASLLGMSQVELWRLWSNMARSGVQRTPAPLICDESRVTQASSGTSLYCVTDYRRFFPGARVMVYDIPGHLPQNVQFVTITSVESDHLVVSALTGTVPVGAVVVPCIDAEINLSILMGLVTDRVGASDFPLFEVYGPSALLATEDDTPTGFDEWGGLPIFSSAAHWGGKISAGMERAGDKLSVGRGEIVYTQGDRPLFQYDLEFRGLTRALAWPVIQFFDSRRGRFKDFWMPSPHDMWEVDAISTSYVDIVADGNVEDFEDFIEYVSVVQTDGTVLVRDVGSVVDNGDTWRIYFGDDIPSLTLADIVRVCPAHQARFAEDSMTEEWANTEVCSAIQLKVTELYNEKEVVV